MNYMNTVKRQQVARASEGRTGGGQGCLSGLVHNVHDVIVREAGLHGHDNLVGGPFIRDAGDILVPDGLPEQVIQAFMKGSPGLLWPQGLVGRVITKGGSPAESRQVGLQVVLARQAINPEDGIHDDVIATPTADGDQFIADFVNCLPGKFDHVRRPLMWCDHGKRQGCNRQNMKPSHKYSASWGTWIPAAKKYLFAAPQSWMRILIHEKVEFSNCQQLIYEKAMLGGLMYQARLGDVICDSNEAAQSEAQAFLQSQVGGHGTGATKLPWKCIYCGSDVIYKAGNNTLRAISPHFAHANGQGKDCERKEASKGLIGLRAPAHLCLTGEAKRERAEWALERWRDIWWGLCHGKYIPGISIPKLSYMEILMAFERALKDNAIYHKDLNEVHLTIIILRYTLLAPKRGRECWHACWIEGKDHVQESYFGGSWGRESYLALGTFERSKDPARPPKIQSSKPTHVLRAPIPHFKNLRRLGGDGNGMGEDVAKKLGALHKRFGWADSV